VSTGIVTTRVSLVLLAAALASLPVVSNGAVTCTAPGMTGARCDDGDRCTQDDVCDGGLCVGERVDCSDADVCNGEETCDPATGRCGDGAPLTCDDGDPCTVDEPCDAAGGCVIRQLPDIEFVRCRATGRLPIAACIEALPRRVRRPLARMRRVLDRTGHVSSIGDLARILDRLDRACRRAKRRLDVALARGDASACLDQQRRALDDVCPDRQVVEPE